MCPGLVDTAHQPVAPQPAGRLVTEQSDGAAFVEQALADGTAGSMSPDEVADLVVDAVPRGAVPRADPAELRGAARPIGARTSSRAARRAVPTFD